MTKENTVSETRAIKYEQEVPDIIRAMSSVHDVMGMHDFDRAIYHLVQLRASQINRCAYCVKMHTKEARQDGETSERLDRLIVWDHVGDFSERERAAFAWTEALTVLDGKTDLGAIRARLREHFTDKEIGVLTSIVAMINLWNRIQISKH